MHVGKVGVIHSSFAKWGGAEEYAAAIIKALTVLSSVLIFILFPLDPVLPGCIAF